MGRIDKQQDNTEIHEILLETIRDIGELCQRHGLRYDLYCGTLLGAVRDRDLIPWDDDADLTMPIGDYRKFYRLAQKELNDRYIIQDLGNTPAHPWLWMRVFRRNTCYLRKTWKSLDVHHGVAVDIYPMIGAAESETGYQLQHAVLNAAKALRHIDYWNAVGYPKNRLQRKTGMALARIPGPVRRSLSLLLLRLAAFPPENKTRCCTLDGADFVPKYDTEDWREEVKLSLAGCEFRAPARYDKLLRIMYGDYETPPPIEKRVGHGADFGGVIIDTKKDYTWYLLKE